MDSVGDKEPDADNEVDRKRMKRLSFPVQLVVAALIKTGEVSSVPEAVRRIEERGLLRGLPGTKLRASPIGEQYS